MVTQRFQEAGLPPFAKEATLRQTTDSHRLIWKAQQVSTEKAGSVALGVESGYFTEGKDIGDVEGHLSDVAVKEGLFASKEEAVKWLKGDEGRKEYLEGIKKARNAGISGVPTWKWVDCSAMGS